MKRPSLFNFSEDKNERVKDTLKGAVGGLTTAALLGYGLKESYLEGKKQYKNLTSLENKLELKNVGETIGKNVKQAEEVLKEIKQKNLSEFVNDLTNRLDTMLNDAESIPVEERRSFFAALFETIKEEQLAKENVENLEDLIKKGYEDVQSLDDAQKTVLKDFFSREVVSSERASSSLSASYKKYLPIINLYDESARKTPFGPVKKQNEIVSYTNIGDLNGKPGFDQPGTFAQIQRKYNEIRGLVGKDASIELLETNEGNLGVKGLYARVRDRQGKWRGNYVLQLGQDSSGSPIFRATESMSSRYVVPQYATNAPDILDTASMRSLKIGSLQQGISSGKILKTEDMFHQMFVRNANPNEVINYDGRVVSQIDAFIRGFGENVSRSEMDMYGTSTSSSLKGSGAARRQMVANQLLILGVEQFDSKKRRGVLREILGGLGQEELVVAGTNRTTLTRTQDPRNRSLRLSYGKLDIVNEALMVNNGQSASPFKYLQGYGRAPTRSSQPQTAREYQMIGRRENIAGLKGVDANATFGVNNNIKMFGVGSELIGVNSQYFGEGRGLNLGAIFLRKDKGLSLGLSEGSQYYTGEVITEVSTPKTILESGIANTKIFNELERRTLSGEGGMRIGTDGEISIEDFFKTYGANGQVVIGGQGRDLTVIRQRKGMENFTLELSEFSRANGVGRYHFSSYMSNVNKNTKLFGIGTKDTMVPIDQGGLERKVGSAALTAYQKSFGGNLSNTLLGTSAMLGKSQHYTSIFMEGGLMMAGVADKGDLDAATRKYIGSDSDYVKFGNEMLGTNYSSVSDFSSREDKAVRFAASTRSVFEIGLRGRLDAEKLGYILAAADEQAENKNFGMNRNIFERIFEGIGDDSYRSNVLKYAKSDIMFGAFYTTSGGIHAELGRNLGRIEPRVFNYAYTSLRSNFNLSQEEATKYMSTLISRQRGASAKQAAARQMYLTQMSLTELGGLDLNKLAASGIEYERLTKEQSRELLTFGQGQERQLADFLGMSKESRIFDFADVMTDQKKLKQVKEMLGGRSTIFLPGMDSLEAFGGFSVKTEDGVKSLEDAYTRNIGDLVSSISSISEASTDREFNAAIRGFKASQEYLGNITGKVLRQALSGEILGSGTFMGGGVVFGKDLNTGGTEMKGAPGKLKELYSAFEQKGGYAVYMDAQAFLDSMGSYKEAAKATLASEGMSGEELEKEASKMTSARLRGFFFGMYGTNKEGVGSDLMRNPHLSLNHFLPDMDVFRYDFENGDQDEFFKLLRSNKIRSTLSNEGKEEVKRLKNIKRFEMLEKWLESRGYRKGALGSDFESFQQNRKELFEKQEALRIKRDKLYKTVGKPTYELDSNDNIVLEEKIKKKRVFNNRTGKYEEVSENTGKQVPKILLREEGKHRALVLERSRKERLNELYTRRARIIERKFELQKEYYGELDLDDEGNIKRGDIRTEVSKKVYDSLEDSQKEEINGKYYKVSKDRVLRLGKENETFRLYREAKEKHQNINKEIKKAKAKVKELVSKEIKDKRIARNKFLDTLINPKDTDNFFIKKLLEQREPFLEKLKYSIEQQKERIGLFDQKGYGKFSKEELLKKKTNASNVKRKLGLDADKSGIDLLLDIQEKYKIKQLKFGKETLNIEDFDSDLLKRAFKGELTNQERRNFLSSRGKGSRLKKRLAAFSIDDLVSIKYVNNGSEIELKELLKSEREIRVLEEQNRDYDRYTKLKKALEVNVELQESFLQKGEPAEGKKKVRFSSKMIMEAFARDHEARLSNVMGLIGSDEMELDRINVLRSHSNTLMEESEVAKFKASRLSSVSAIGANLDEKTKNILNTADLTTKEGLSEFNKALNIAERETIVALYTRKTSRGIDGLTDFQKAVHQFFGLHNPENVRRYINYRDNEARKALKDAKGQRSLQRFVFEIAGIQDDFEERYQARTREIIGSNGEKIRLTTTKEIEEARLKVQSLYSKKEESFKSVQELRKKKEGLLKNRRKVLSQINAGIQKYDEEIRTLKEEPASEEEKKQLESLKKNRDELKKVKDELKVLEEQEQTKIFRELAGETKEEELDDGSVIKKNTVYSLSSEDDGEIKRNVSSLGGNFVEDELIETKASPLRRLEEFTGRKIDSFEELKSVYDLGADTSFDYEIRETLPDGSESVKKQSTTIGEEVDSIMMRVMNQHTKYGAEGGGLVYFPTMDVEGTLKDASGKTFKFSERIDYSRMMIGDFDADYYQVFHSTARRVNGGGFNKAAGSFFGLYASGAEYLATKEILGEGMKKLGTRLGVQDLNTEQFILEEFGKEQTIKNVGGLDVSVKTTMLGFIKAGEEMAARGGDADAYAKHMRSGANLISIAQEVLAIKAKHLDIAAGVAEQFNVSLRRSMKEGSGDAVFDFLKENVFKGTLFESGDNVKFADAQILNLPSGKTREEMEKTLRGLEINMQGFKSSLDAAFSAIKNNGLESLGSDKRMSQGVIGSSVANLRMFNQMITSSAEGSFLNVGGEVDFDLMDQLMRNSQISSSSFFNGALKSKGIGGLALAGIVGSYALGASSPLEKLEIENKFSDATAKEMIGNRQLSAMNVNRDSSISGSALSSMGAGNMYQRPIMENETMVVKNNRSRYYGEAPTYGEAASIAGRMVASGGKAYIGVNDTRLPISNSYINKSLRD